MGNKRNRTSTTQELKMSTEKQEPSTTETQQTQTPTPETQSSDVVESTTLNPAVAEDDTTSTSGDTETQSESNADTQDLKDGPDETETEPTVPETTGTEDPNTDTTQVSAVALPSHLRVIDVALLGTGPEDTEAYVKVMASNRTWVRADGYRAQRSLLNTLRHIFNLNGEQFFEAFNHFLAIVNDYSDDCFAIRYALRGVQDVDCGFSKAQGKFIEAIISLSCRIANPATRQVKVQQTIEIEKVTSVATALNPAYGEKLRAYLERFV